MQTILSLTFGGAWGGLDGEVGKIELPYCPPIPCGLEMVSIKASQEARARKMSSLADVCLISALQYVPGRHFIYCMYPSLISHGRPCYS